MKRNVIFILFTVLLTSARAQDYTPIPVKAASVMDTFYDHYIVEDRFRWMENLQAQELTQWLGEQNKMSEKYLTTCSNKTSTYWSIDKNSFAQYQRLQKIGGYFFQYFYTDKNGLPVLYYKRSPRNRSEELINPNYVGQKDKILLRTLAVSADDKYLAYTFSRNGVDWAEAKVMNLHDGTMADDHLKGLKHNGVAWWKEGFFYSTYHNDSPLGETLDQKIYYHRLGTRQSEDELVFDRKNPRLRFTYRVTSDERFLIIKEIDEEKDYVNIFYKDFATEMPVLRPLLMKRGEYINILDSRNGKLIAEVDTEEQSNKIVAIDPANPYRWEEITPGFSGAVLVEASPHKNCLVALYVISHQPVLSVFDYNGNSLYTLEFPVGTSVGELTGEMDDEILYFNYESYSLPPISYEFNLTTFQKNLLDQIVVNFDYENFITEEVTYQTRDSVEVPMLLVYKEGMERNGKNPVLLNTYGGFGAITAPSFNPGIVHFVQEGGIFAYASVRGSGNKGHSWSWAGRGHKKENAIHDFIDAAAFLIENDYTNARQLAASGTSNGGLIVASAAVKRPDLFSAVVPIVAPTDMLRFEKFTVGHMHTDEYGTVADSTSFTHLYSYSPYHNIKEETNYPAMLFITGENDDRVPPFHAYKFVARLQERAVQKHPVLLSVRENAGHIGGNSSYTRKRERADIYGFILWHTRGED
ncbi:MAG: prolyl oligopeptidase family serine peptidase [Bacteroidota bacterium]